MAVDPSKLRRGDRFKLPTDWRTVELQVIRPSKDGELVLETDKGLRLKRNVDCLFWEDAEFIRGAREDEC